MKKMTDKEFRLRVFNAVKDEYEFLDSYVNTRTHLHVNHKKCNKTYRVTPHDFLSGRRCPFCSGKMKKSTEELKKQVSQLTNNEYCVLGDYVNNKTKILMFHNECQHEFYMRPDCFISGTRCPHCNEIRQHEYNCHGKKYSINENFFSEWSSNMAYILGVIASDGNLSKSKFRLTISSIDYEFLKSINHELNSNRVISKSSNKLGSWYSLTIDNRQIYKDLINLGLTPNKSFTCNINYIPDKYKLDFLRGYFDGDGCVYMRKYTKSKQVGLSVEIATASMYMKDIILFILREVCIHCKYDFKSIVRKNGLFIIRGYTSVSQILYKRMYYDGCLHLQRKKDKFDAILSHRSNAQI